MGEWWGEGSGECSVKGGERGGLGGERSRDDCFENEPRGLVLVWRVGMGRRLLVNSGDVDLDDMAKDWTKCL